MMRAASVVGNPEVVARAESEAVQVKPNQREHLLAALLAGLELSLSEVLSFVGSGPGVCLFV